jgi:arylsulfatase A-like enzyme
MNSRYWLGIGLLLIILGFHDQVRADTTALKPNIVIMLADDLGIGDLAVYNADSKIKTPNLDALAATGLRMTDAHSPSSVCTPTRYGLLTGRYAWRTSLKKGVLKPWEKPLIEPGRETLAKMLKQRGYTTACIGKWHLGWHWPVEDLSNALGGGPLAAGFDYYFGDDVPNYPPYAFIENNKLLNQPDTEKPDHMFGNPGPMVSGWDLTAVMPTITEKAVQYIEGQSSEQDPFFLYFALTAPHTPIAPSPEFIGKSAAGRYGDYVQQVDYTVGQVVEALKNTGQWEHTILVFTSDNGSPQRDGTDMAGPTGSVKKYGHDPSKPYRGMKADIWEGGHRVPFIVSWPEKISAGQVSHQLFGLNDLMATLASITKSATSIKRYEDSLDFSEIWQGQSETPVRQHLVLHSIKGMFAIRQGPWKLIMGQGSGGWSQDLDGDDAPGQLYNLDQDKPEKNNLYHQYPQMVADLTKQLNQIKEQGYSNPGFK